MAAHIPIALVHGTFAAIPGVVTGLNTHEPYEETPVMASITPHPGLGPIGMAVLLVVLVSCWVIVRGGTPR